MNGNMRVWGLLLAITLAPTAQATSLPISRDTGVGLEIAAQGNLALRSIRAELLQQVRRLQPTLPAQPVPASLPAGGPALSFATGQRCAK